MARLDKRKKGSVLAEVTGQDPTKDPNEFIKITFTLRRRDRDALEKYIEREQDRTEQHVNKSLVIRKALQLLYRQKKPFDQV